MSPVKVLSGGLTHHASRSWQSKHSVRDDREEYLVLDHHFLSYHAGETVDNVVVQLFIVDAINAFVSLSVCLYVCKVISFVLAVHSINGT